MIKKNIKQASMLLQGETIQRGNFGAHSEKERHWYQDTSLCPPLRGVPKSWEKT